jgi:hypothetical protein
LAGEVAVLSRSGSPHEASTREIARKSASR